MQVVEVLTCVLVSIQFFYVMWITTVLHNMIQGLYKRGLTENE